MDGSQETYHEELGVTKSAPEKKMSIATIHVVVTGVSRNFQKEDPRLTVWPYNNFTTLFPIVQPRIVLVALINTLLDILEVMLDAIGVVTSRWRHA